MFEDTSCKLERWKIESAGVIIEESRVKFIKLTLVP